MYILMTIIAGMSVSLAIYFLVSAIMSNSLYMDADTVHKIGIVPSTFIFAVCGPVLVLKLWFGDRGGQSVHSGFVSLIVITCLSVFWCGVLGIVTTQPTFMHIASF